MSTQNIKPKFEINGKVLIFSDLHIGLKDSATNYMNIAISAVKEIRNAVKKYKIQTVIFCGDLFHVRKYIELRALNCALTLISALSKCAKVYMIVGNHDTFYKNSNDVNSVNIFKDNPNVVLVPDLATAKINGKLTLFVPWLGDVSKFREETYDMLFGHFDISSEYLINSYIEEHSAKSSPTDELQKELGLEEESYKDKIGNFINVVKKEGYVFSGHIHQRKEFISKSRNIVFIGSPYQQNFGEIDSVDGYYVMDENCKFKFHKIKNTPKHMYLRISEILKEGIDKYDFSKIRGNIIKKVYDASITKEEETKINQQINLFEPFDELLPEQEVIMEEDSDEGVTCESLELIKKSKLDYIQTYINNIDDDTLHKLNLEKDKIFDTMKFYFEKVGQK
jgi:DNA repair exonuclease SbcCD nuclease subunit